MIARASLVCALALALGLPAAADARRPLVRPTAVKTTIAKSGGVVIDWSRGLLIARAGAAADLRAPTAGIARVKAKRTALKKAREKASAAAVRWLQSIGMSDVSKKPEWKAIGSEIAALDVQYATDGSVIAVVGLPIESVRRVALPTVRAPPTSRDGPTALIVDARTVMKAPAFGLAVGAGAESYRGPMLFFRRAVPLELFGKRPKRHVAREGDKTGLRLAPSAAAELAAARDARAPIFVLIK